MRLLVLALLVGCQSPTVPWLHGFDERVSSTGVDTPGAPADEPNDGCGVAVTRKIELVADVAPSAGRETIVASFQDGISVFDREEHLVSELPGYPCEGSADELDVIAVGRAYGKPMVAIAATSGGRHETATFIGLFRPGEKLQPLFTAVVETRSGDTITRGAIYLLPEGLLYQRPGGGFALWRLEDVYVPVLPEEPHDEPPLVSQR